MILLPSTPADHATVRPDSDPAGVPPYFPNGGGQVKPAKRGRPQPQRGRTKAVRTPGAGIPGVHDAASTPAPAMASFPSSPARCRSRSPRRGLSIIKRLIKRGEYYEDLPIVIATTAERPLEDLHDGDAVGNTGGAS